MRFLGLILALITLSANATQPEYLKDATITVKLKNGKTYTFSANEYAVVKRDQMGQDKDDSEMIVVNNQKSKKKNRVYGTVGYGLNGGQDITKSGDVHSISPSSGARVGAGYMRQVNDDLNLGVQIKTNGDMDLTVGTDF